jgi:hypothetical protein
MRGKKQPEVRAVNKLRVLVDMRGRTFERGSALAGRPDIKVKDIRVVGNFATVEFEPAVQIPQVPPPIVLHIDDVQAFEAAGPAGSAGVSSEK